MKIRQAPVADLMKYIDELYADRENNKHKHILNVIDKYYCSITNHKTIMPICDDFLGDWCDLNYSPTMENCPNVPGLIIYKNNPDGSKTYGLMYHSGYIVPRLYQTDYMAYYDIDKHGHIASHTYLQSEWDGWGAPTRFFSFNPEDYQDSSVWTLGERPLMKHKFGHDVRQLQTLLHKIYPEIPLTGYFDDKTLEVLHFIQYWCKIPQTDIFILNSPEGQKILELLNNNEHKNLANS